MISILRVAPHIACLFYMPLWALFLLVGLTEGKKPFYLQIFFVSSQFLIQNIATNATKRNTVNSMKINIIPAIQCGIKSNLVTEQSQGHFDTSIPKNRAKTIADNSATFNSDKNKYSFHFASPFLIGLLQIRIIAGVVRCKAYNSSMSFVQLFRRFLVIFFILFLCNNL